MSQIRTRIELSRELASRFAALGDTPYAPETISTVCRQNGWKQLPPEDCESDGDSLLRIQIPDGPPIVALWGAESIAGLPLCVVFQDDVTVPISDATWEAFDSLFIDAKRLCERQFGPPTKDGKYESDWINTSIPFCVLSTSLLDTRGFATPRG